MNLRRLLPLTLLLMVGLGVATGHQSFVMAEGNNEFPPVEGTGYQNWVLRSTTPDPNLTWTYNDSGRQGEVIEHILKNEKSSDVRRINLKLYFDSQPTSPIQITSRSPYCALDANSGLGNTLSMYIGSTRTYYQGAHREGLYNVSERYEGRSFDNRIDDDTSANGTTNPNKRWDWKLQADNNKDNDFRYDAIPSRICESDPNSTKFKTYQFDEQCAPANQKAGGVCDNDGNERWERAALKGSYDTDNPGNSCPSGGTSCQFANYIHTAPASEAQFDPVTGKWYVKVTTVLDGSENDEQLLTGYSGNPGSGWDTKHYKNVQQQIRFRLEASSGTFGYGEPDPSAVGGPAQQFGLAAGQTDESDGVKLAVPFGIPCDQPSGGGFKSISLYDVDSDRFGPSFIKIFQRDPEGTNYPNNVVASPEGSYRNGPNAVMQSGAVRMKLEDGENGTGTFEFNMQFGMQYMAVITNPYLTGRSSPIQNVFSLKLPNESIYGVENCKYNLTPEIDDISRTFEYSPDIPLAGRIKNDSAPGGNHDWQVTKIVFNTKPSNMHGTQEDSLDPPCVHAAAGNSGSSPNSCTNLNQKSGGGSAIYPETSSYGANFADASPYAIGKHICFMTSVKRPQWNLDVNLWRHSRMVCSQSVKKPRVQFLGSDLRVEGTAIASKSNINGTTYGSWVEYGIFSTGVNNFVGSGNGLRDGNPTGEGEDAWSRLTFANKTGYGNYGPTLPAPTTALTYFRGLQATSVTGPSAATVPAGVYDISGGDLGSTLDRTTDSREGVIIRSSGDVRISKNIRVNNNGLSRVDQIAQVVIVAPNITIDPGVEQVDAWLITPRPGVINTCTGSGNLTLSDCDKRLTISGAVYTSDLRLRRTAGSDPVNVDALKAPAEVFYLRPESILWAYTYANKGDYAQTDYVQELPPRY